MDEMSFFDSVDFLLSFQKCQVFTLLISRCSEQNSVEMLAIRSISLENIDHDENKIFNDKERLVEIFHSMVWF